MTTGQAYVHGQESAVGFIVLFPDRLVYRVHVVTDHGYPIFAFSQNSLLQSRPVLVLVTTLLAAAFVTLPSPTVHSQAYFI